MHLLYVGHIMKRYVCQPADGDHIGLYEVAVWNESKQQYISNGGPYYESREVAEEIAHQLNVEREQ